MSFNKCRLVILNYPISVPGPGQHLQFWSMYAEFTFTTRGQHGIESVELEAAVCFMDPVGWRVGWGLSGTGTARILESRQAKTYFLNSLDKS